MLVGAWIDDVTRAELMICLVVVEGDSYGVNFYAANTRIVNHARRTILRCHGTVGGAQRLPDI